MSQSLRWLRPAALVAAAALAWAPLPAAWIEAWYSQGPYLFWQRHLTSWTNAAPFAVTDLLLAVAGIAAGAWVWRLARALRQTTSRGRTACAALGRAAVVVAVVYLVFLLSWGLNYRREPLVSRLSFDRSRVTTDAVRALARETVSRVNDLHEAAHASPAGEWADMPALIGPAFGRLQREIGVSRPAVPGLPKWSLSTYYFERAGVAGLTNPFALEVVVDWAQLPVERPFVAAHEWAHLAGFANEAEANAVGWMVCLQGPPLAEYSARLDLLPALAAALPPGERAAIFGPLGPGPRRDLAEIRRHASHAWAWLERPAWWLYDRYLRANRVRQGVGSYGLALELLVGTRFAAAGVPQPRTEPR